ncbi:MAG: phosphoribosyltransferase family protein [Candidatus Magasanikbacteria bacterium]
MILLSNTSIDGKKLASKLKCQFCHVNESEYPDGEKTLTIKVGSKKVDFIYFKFNKNSSFDDQLFELLCLINSFAYKKQTILILPYLPYLRSCPTSKNEVDKLEFVLKTIGKQVKNIYLLYPHITTKQIKKCIKIKNIITIDIDNLIIKQIKSLGKYLVLVSPDEGFSENIKKLSQKSGLPYVILNKKRISPTKVVVQTDKKTQKIITLANTKTFVLIDDIISTGNTLFKASDYLKSLGVKNIKFIVVHNTSKDTRTNIICSNSLISEKNIKTFDNTDSIVTSIKNK